MEDKREDNIRGKSSSTIPTGIPINWSLITGPVPVPASVNVHYPPHHTSAVHALQTKVKPVTQRRTRGRDRENERERYDTEVLVSSPVSLRQRPRTKGQGSLLPNSRRTGATNNHSSSDEEEEVEVQVRLEIHNPPAQGQQMPTVEGRPNSFPTGGLKEGTSLESLLSDNSSSSKDDPSTPPSSSATISASPSSSSSSTSSMPARHWAPPKGFWRVARPETLLLNGIGLHDMPPTLPVKDYTQTDGPQRKSKPGKLGTTNDVVCEWGDSKTSAEDKCSDSVEHSIERCEQRDVAAAAAAGDRGLCSSGSSDSMSSHSSALSASEKLMVKQRAYTKLRDKQQNCSAAREKDGGDSPGPNGDTKVDCDVPSVQGILEVSDSPTVTQELEPYLRSLLVNSDELPLSPRHEQAKRILERARRKARSSHAQDKPDCSSSPSDWKPTETKQQIEAPDPVPEQKPVQMKADATTQTPLPPRDTSPSDQGGRARRYGCSPSWVRFEDESEKEAESRYLDRVRERGRTGAPASMPEDGGISGETVIKEIIVLVKKCEACGSVVREPQPIFSEPSAPQDTEAQLLNNPEDPQVQSSPRCVPPYKPETNARPKGSLTVTFAGAYVLGENEENSTGWKSSGFGKLRRRSRKGESRMESGHGPYGPSWAQRRNSNPRTRGNPNRAVSFAPGSPITLEPCLLEASAGPAPPHQFPIKSALKSSSRNRTAAGQSTVTLSEEAVSQHSSQQDSSEVKWDTPVSLTQGSPATSIPASCIRPSTLRYSPSRNTSDLAADPLWEATPDATGGELVPGAECRPPLRGMVISRTEDLRAELLRAEHLKAGAFYEENSDGSRKLDGRPKLFLRRFFSSIGLNSVGRLVKGGRSNSMEQLSMPTQYSHPRAGSASPSPTRRPQPTIQIQRTPSLQSLHTVLPLVQLRKASSVQSLERRTERTTILGEVQIPFGLAPSPHLELHRALSEDVLASKIVRPVGWITKAFPDGTLLLQLIRPPNGPFGFVISRGKGRPDTGVYIEKVVDGSGESPYVGLLGVGDEILEVNGEVVAGLSLDQVTRLMTRKSTASLRIMPTRRNQR